MWKPWSLSSHCAISLVLLLARPDCLTWGVSTPPRRKWNSEGISSQHLFCEGGQANVSWGSLWAVSSFVRSWVPWFLFGFPFCSVPESQRNRVKERTRTVSPSILPSPLGLRWSFHVFSRTLASSRSLSSWKTSCPLMNVDCCLLAQSCPTLCDPMDCSPPVSCVLGILQARILEWVAMPFSRRSSQPRNQTRVSSVSCVGRQVLYHWSPGRPTICSVLGQAFCLS